MKNKRSIVYGLQSKISRCRGFTLIELLLVVSVIAILAGLLLPAFGRVREAAREKQADIEAQIIGHAIAAYKLQNRRFPAPENHLSGNQDRSYGEGASGGANGLVMRPLRDADPPVLDPNRLTWQGDNVVNPWGQQYRITLDLDYDGRVDGSRREYRVELNKP